MDLEPIIKVTKSDLKIMAKELGVPDSIIRKRSSPNLLAKHDAEEELGVSYAFLDKLLDKAFTPPLPPKGSIFAKYLRARAYVKWPKNDSCPESTLR